VLVVSGGFLFRDGKFVETWIRKKIRRVVISVGLGGGDFLVVFHVGHNATPVDTVKSYLSKQQRGSQIDFILPTIDLQYRERDVTLQ
jgi:hypothetical protein